MTKRTKKYLERKRMDKQVNGRMPFTMADLLKAKAMMDDAVKDVPKRIWWVEAAAPSVIEVQLGFADRFFQDHYSMAPSLLFSQ